MKKSALLLSLLILFILGGCEKKVEKNPIATIEMENGGKIVIELYYDKAPNTVKNFVSLANKGFYDGVVFHRIVPGFMIQGGDPDGNGRGGPGYRIKGEFPNNSFKQNDLLHKRGVISMARTPSYDTASSQFFILVADYPSLDGEYAPFGMVTEGMDVADRIVSGKANGQIAVNPEAMKSVRVETFGQDIGEPEIIK